MMNCLEWLPIYFGILKSGAIAVPLNFRYSSDEIEYCLDLADIEVLVFGPEFTERIEPVLPNLREIKYFFFVGKDMVNMSQGLHKRNDFNSASGSFTFETFYFSTAESIFAGNAAVFPSVWEHGLVLHKQAVQTGFCTVFQHK